ncbi:hypothetical protein P8935_06315 [Telmatobacter sp. DSM 110680]|uniref:Zinc-ribbon domain-containing protein n=1 Tax=Telmatobacter sp. DSM 110680 TaxID=3036704 RepID=A0AAU7DNE5_9BACT
MEITCNRCHQAVPVDSCYCPACGLPQLVYTTEGESAVPPSSERWPEPVRDASSIDWKPGMRAALTLAIPAGLLCSSVSPIDSLEFLWMVGAAILAVFMYMRSQRPSWITIGAGARLGLVTGLVAAWLAFGVSGCWLFTERVLLHQSGQIDVVYKAFLDTFQQRVSDSLAGMNAADAARMQPVFARMQAIFTSPEGHAGVWTLSILFNCAMLVLFAAGGGALGARLEARRRRPEV